MKKSDGGSSTTGRFIGPGEPVDIAVIVVTYRSAAHIERLIPSLRREAGTHRMRVVVADNDSPDGTLEVARAHRDVVAMPTGGNLGYAGGINVAMAAVGDADAILVLNPDMVVVPGAIAAMRARLSQPGVGIVVPTILDGEGARTRSLRREPSVMRSVGDAVFGGRFHRRPGVFAETVLRSAEYTTAHRVDWATGAALLISRETAGAVGDWDERYFLYSEETDYFRRAREAGYAAWFEPTAVVRHSEGGSGVSVDLDRLLAVNRIRYYAKHHGRFATTTFLGVAVLNHLVRSADPGHRAILRTVATPHSWSALPRASRTPAPRVAREAEGTPA
ncbi:glycosyltransferase family 2 protein [Microbacterium cremeum]|uniref:glycosyltransferase family 2 protein n=1 Tax=Microbacterium cremeum TaxID=2782169 RepID=UPI0018892916|nr:glycosyltransferase family 2 protein [Microbacterium cremeum]